MIKDTGHVNEYPTPECYSKSCFNQHSKRTAQQQLSMLKNVAGKEDSTADVASFIETQLMFSKICISF